MVQQTVSHAEFPAEQLLLEITDTAMVWDDTVAAHTLRDLESHGIRNALDDFGTGNSSLT